MISRYLISIFLLLIACNAMAATCSKPIVECVEKGGTRDFGGIPVTLDCWQEKVTYECKDETNNTCLQLKDQGCSPTIATCKNLWEGNCTLHEVTYDCPIRKCDHKEVVCSNTKVFCATGNCMPHERSKDNDIGKSLAALSAAAEAAKHLGITESKDVLKIFGGKPLECSKNILSGVTKDCCGITPSGFLEGKILECVEDEKKIAVAKEAGTAVYLGEYCHNKVLGVCTSHHQTYCLFQSKLARIIQVAARSQLNIPFGGPQSANCRPLTQDEFQHVDFSKIDFGEFIQEIKEKAERRESDGKVTDRAKQTADEYKKQAENFKGNVEKMREKMQSKMRGTQERTEKETEVSINDREKEKAKGW